MDFRDISVIPSSDVSTLIVLHPLDHVAEPLVVLQKVLGEAAVASVESLGLDTEYISQMLYAGQSAREIVPFFSDF